MSKPVLTYPLSIRIYPYPTRDDYTEYGLVSREPIPDVIDMTSDLGEALYSLIKDKCDKNSWNINDCSVTRVRD